jgi:D-apionolactonase
MESYGFPLRAGPLTATLDRGELRWIRLGDLEVLRGIYGAVRGPGWVTVPPKLKTVRVEAGEEAFAVVFEARHEDGPLRFGWHGRIEGERDGTIRFVFEGRAETAFLKNRVGLCVLHPTEGCAGRPCEVEHADGRRTIGAFPGDVAPHQPFLDVRAIRHAVAPGRTLEVRLEGEWFETEDQRNWSDASFKTYSTSLAHPFPARMEAGEKVRHEVVVRLVEGSAIEGDADVATGAVAATSSPSRPLRVGLGLPVGRPLFSREVELLVELRLDHLRVLLQREQVWGDELAHAAEAARACGTRLEVAVHVGEDGGLDHLAEACVRVSAPVAQFLVFRHNLLRSDPGLLGRARSLLAAAAPGALIGGGADGWFAELNRNREAALEADVVAFALSPQVHARDEVTIRENLASLGDVARTARTFAGPAEIALSPVTLAPPSEAADARLSGRFGGRWVKELLLAARAAGFASLTLAPGAGPGGVIVESFETAAWQALRDRDP